MKKSSSYLIVPCYNEVRRLDFSAFESFLKTAPIKLIFVNDASTDETLLVLKRFQKQQSARVFVVDQTSNRGKAAAVRAGCLFALEKGAEQIGYCDADLSAPLSEISRLFAALERESADAVIGARIRFLGTDINRSAFRHYVGRFFATFASIALRLGVYDTQCGAKVFRVSPRFAKALGTDFNTRWTFDCELLARLLEQSTTKEQVQILELPLYHWQHTAGSRITLKQIPIILRDVFLLWVLLSKCRQRPQTEIFLYDEGKKAA